MKKIVAILMVMLMVISVMVVLASNAATTKEEQKEKVDLQIFENNALNVPGGEGFVPGEFIVKFKPGVGKGKIDEINSKHGAFVKYTSSYGKFKRIGIPKHKTVPEMVEIYSKNPNVEYAEPNQIVRALKFPNDRYYRFQWHLDIPKYKEKPEWHGENGGGINIEPAWKISTGTNVIVAILDTGVAYENYQGYVRAPDLAETCFVQGKDFVNNDDHPNDDHSHGTHVAGTVAQSTNNRIGVAGVAFGACIMPVKVLGANGEGTNVGVADGIYYAANNSAQVISMSLGGPDQSETIEEALAYAYGKGVTIVAASGNGGPNGPPSYPAAYDDYVIAVGATRYDEAVSDYSTTGDYVDIAAPGGDLTIDQNGDSYGDGVLQNTFDPDTKDPKDFGYWFFQGTSMATPHVSGVAALLIAKGVTGPDNVREALEKTAEDKGDFGLDPEYGWGIVDAYAAVNYGSPPTCSDYCIDQGHSGGDCKKRCNSRKGETEIGFPCSNTREVCCCKP
jgi:serine protease